MSRPPCIAVFGSSQTGTASPTWNVAETLGRHLAETGYAVLTGGYGGVMEATSKGAHEAGGDVIGVTCDVFAHRKGGNPYLTETRHTQTLPERLLALVDGADAFIVLHGGVGTLAELFLAWNLVVLGDGRPLVVLGTAMHDAVEALARHAELDPGQRAMLHLVQTPEEALAVLRTRVPPPRAPLG